MDTGNEQRRIPKAAEVIAADLRRRIIGGELRPGQVLQSVSEQATAFGVSGPIFTESLRMLEAEGLVTVRRGVGGGITIGVPNEDAVSYNAGLLLQYRGATIGDLYTAREHVEASAVKDLGRLAPADIDRLEASIDEAAAGNTPQAQVAAHMQFHQILVELGGNQVISLMVTMMHRVIQGAVVSHVKHKGGADSRREVAERAEKSHRRLVALLRADDKHLADELWRRHLEHTRELAVAELGADHLLEFFV